MSKSKQLWKLTDERCELISRVNRVTKKKHKVNQPNIPVLFYPDGSICWEATMWITRNNNLKVLSNKQNTRVDEASLLSFLLKYVYKNKVTFSQLNDDDIFDFIDELKGQNNKKNSQIRKIVIRALNFLMWYQSYLLSNDNLIGESPQHQITIKKVTKRQKNKNKYFIMNYITHRYLPNCSISDDVRPVKDSDIDKLYEAIKVRTTDPLIQKRDENILRMLEFTGGRRIEVSRITVEDIEDAYRKGEIKLFNFKRRDNSDPTRVIPVSQEFIRPVRDYIRGHRRLMLNREGIIPSKASSNVFLTNKGSPLSEKTITQYVNQLSKIANIQATPRKFRHRFITIQVAVRLKGYARSSLPMDVANTILTKVSTLSGHKNPKSLFEYIDFAFDELGVWDEAEKNLKSRADIESAHRTLVVLKSDIKSNNISKDAVLIEMEKVVDLLLNQVLTSEPPSHN